MNVITHFLTGWVLAEHSGLNHRDRSLVTWACVLPDADGLGVLPDLANQLLGRPATDFYAEWHHMMLHGIFGAFLISACAYGLAKNKARTAVFAFAAVHLHLLCDLLGSRGATAEEIWPLNYLAPFTNAWPIAWNGQWALNAWPNLVLTIALLAYTFHRAVRTGKSPVSMFHAEANEKFVEALRRRWSV